MKSIHSKLLLESPAVDNPPQTLSARLVSTMQAEKSQISRLSKSARPHQTVDLFQKKVCEEILILMEDRLASLKALLLAQTKSRKDAKDEDDIQTQELYRHTQMQKDFSQRKQSNDCEQSAQKIDLILAGDAISKQQTLVDNLKEQIKQIESKLATVTNDLDSLPKPCSSPHITQVTPPVFAPSSSLCPYFPPSSSPDSFFFPKGIESIPQTYIKDLSAQWLQYEPEAMNKLLSLRFKGLESQIDIRGAKLAETPRELLFLAKNMLGQQSSDRVVLQPLIANEEVSYHWIALMSSKTGQLIGIDSSNSNAMNILVDGGYAVRAITEIQKYNNCGLTVIEASHAMAKSLLSINIGPEASQEEAPYLHSALVQKDLGVELPQAEIQMLEKFSMPEASIRFAPQIIFNPLALTTVANSQSHLDDHFELNTIGNLIPNLKKWIEATPGKGELRNNALKALGKSPAELKADSSATRAIEFFAHPDRAGIQSTSDFQSFRQLVQYEYEWNPTDTVSERSLGSTLEPLIHKVSVGVKVAWTAVNFIEFFIKPTEDTAKGTAVSLCHLYSALSGASIVGITASALSIAHTAYKNGKDAALKEAAGAALYVAAPVVATLLGPYALASYTVLMTGVGVYHLPGSISSLYKNWNSDESYTAWERVTNWLATTRLANTTGINSWLEQKTSEYGLRVALKQTGLTNDLSEQGYGLYKAIDKSPGEYYCEHPLDQTVHRIKVSGDLSDHYHTAK